MTKNIVQPHSQVAVSLILNQLNHFESDKIDLSDRVQFSQYETVQTMLTHQNHGFLTDLAPGQADDREFYDICTPMIETAVANTNLNTDNIDAYVDDPDYQAHEYFARLVLRSYMRQTNQGVELNEMIYKLYDDGNIIVRRIDDGQEIYRPVLPQNLFIVDQSAKTLEDTPVIERYVMNQTDVRNTKGWDNVDLLFKYGDLGENSLTPYYEIFYWYGEISKKRLGRIKQEVHGIKYNYKKGDNNNYVNALLVMARVKIRINGGNEQTNFFRNDQGTIVPGIILFAEELKPQTFKITKKIKIKRYKPYESVRLGKYKNRFWGEGYREICQPYQNRANELGNQIRDVMKIASRLIFWSPDDTIAGKNILSAIENGQIILAKDLQILNNVFPNLSLYAEEWNRNMDEATKALKAFEAASGENLPSSASATAVVVQNQAIGKYYDFKREKIGLFLSIIYKRWVLPALFQDMDEEEALELSGDASFMEEMIDAYIRGSIILTEMKITALSGGTMYQEGFDMLTQMKKQELMKSNKLFATVSKEFFKDIEIYVGINVTGEGFNKQGRISNILAMLQYETNPNILSNPDALDDLNEVRQMLGLKVKKSQPQPNPQTNGQPANTPTTQPGNGNLPIAEKSNAPKTNAKPNML
jgi:hypothetical protein